MIKACPDVILKFITKTINNRILLLVYNIVIASKYVDVLSFNQYVNELNDFHFPGKEEIDKPFIISEFMVENEFQQKK